MRRRIYLLMAVMMAGLIILSGCSGKTDGRKETEKTEESQVMSDKNLISVSDFIDKSGIPEEKLKGIDIEQFIRDYEITESDIGVLNIERLIDEYGEVSQTEDVSSIFDADGAERTAGFTEDVTAIAFYENINTGIRSVYIDVVNGYRYKREEGYVFDNLSSGVREEYTGSEKLLEELNDNAVFTWISSEDTEGIEDAQSMALAVEYSDGSKFTVMASGILSKLLPSNYNYVKELFFN